MIDKDKVRVLAIELRENTIPSGYENVITNWLEQNQPETVIVGLSDVQVRELTTHFICEKPDVDSPKECHEVISNYLKTQTFAQPENLIVSNSTQLKPNWDDAPKNAVALACDRYNGWNWHTEVPIKDVSSWESNGKKLVAPIENWQQTLEPRPTPPAPKVEVGQVWNQGAIEVKVIGVNDCEVAFKNVFNDGFIVYSLEDFLVMFGRVE